MSHGWQSHVCLCAIDSWQEYSIAVTFDDLLNDQPSSVSHLSLACVVTEDSLESIPPLLMSSVCHRTYRNIPACFSVDPMPCSPHCGTEAQGSSSGSLMEKN